MPPPQSSNDPAALEARLRARQPELERSVMTRIFAISDPSRAPDPSYVDGLRVALAAAVDYGLAAIAETEREPRPVPVELLAQARLAARNGVSLEAVLRRYAAGHSLLADGVLEEAEALGIGLIELKSVLRALAARYDRIVAAVGDEYTREASPGPPNAERRRLSLVRRLLAGEQLEATELGYPMDGQHLAIVGSGLGTEEALSRLAQRLDRRLLIAAPEERLIWAWLGGRERFGREEIDVVASNCWPADVRLACGTPGRGLAGWRLSYRQASSALGVALRRPRAFTRYCDVALLAAILRDEDLIAYLTETYLAPLKAERGRAETLRGTLRAYFAADCNAASAASGLGISRQTVTSRLRTVEGHLDCSLRTCRGEMEAALGIAEITDG
jgi:hypothetical protein